MNNERIPDDIMRSAKAASGCHCECRPSFPCERVYSVARAILAERNRVHKQLKGEGE